MKKYSVTIKPTNKTQSFPEGTLLLDALMDMDVTLKTPCGGKGICGKCSIKAEGRLSEPTEQEKKISLEKGLRLACQARIEGDITLLIEEIPTDKTDKRAVYPVIDPKSSYGIAVDIGTTTVQIKLVDMILKESFMIESFLNPQRRFGHDVIARITASGEPDKYNQLVHLIQRGIIKPVLEFSEEVNLPSGRIEKFVFSGNTTMMHFLFKLDVSTIGVYPFKPSQLDFDNFGPDDIDGNAFSEASIYALPAASSFLGADLIGGLTLCLEEGYRNNTLFIDMGTNGELFIINPSGEILAASCAMGPALEGMNISSGMTADDGAITHIAIAGNRLKYEMLGNNLPVGISGTAIIDIIAALLERRIILPSGAFSKDISSNSLPAPAQFIEEGNIKKITIWNNIALTQKDIRNVQLAKGASLSAANILLSEAGCGIEDIEHVLIAGAFGEHLNIENYKRLRFLPDFPKANYSFLGNSSLRAAEQALYDPSFMEKAKNIRDRVRVVELSMHPSFNDEFIKAISFG